MTRLQIKKKDQATIKEENDQATIKEENDKATMKEKNDQFTSALEKFKLINTEDRLEREGRGIQKPYGL